MAFKHRSFLPLVASTFLLLWKVPARAGDFDFYLAPPPAVWQPILPIIPVCPSRCQARVIYVSTDQAKFIGDYEHKRGWHEFLCGNGMFFPEGGFVVYQPATGFCVVASTNADLDVAGLLPK